MPVHDRPTGSRLGSLPARSAAARQVRRPPIAPILTLALLAAGPAVPTARALEGDDRQPMLIEADKVELDETQDTSVYLGNVQVDQGSMRLTADHVTVYHQDDRRIRYIVALGEPVKYKQLTDDGGEVQAFAKRMDYDAHKDELVLTRDALLIQGPDRIASERIVYDRARERMRAGGSGRVKITIVPDKGEASGEAKPGGDGVPPAGPGPASATARPPAGP